MTPTDVTTTATVEITTRNNNNNDDDDDDNDTSKSIINGLQLTYGTEMINEIVNHCRILLVGAGGIGCELLKNLVLCGFTQITIVDLDTIDISNLNRQLLFRSQHVGQPKCQVACSVAEQLSIHASTGSIDDTGSGSGNDHATNGKLKYTALHGNVCDTTQFHTDFMKQYDIVLNALDNVTARRRVNRLCLATSIPLIEAGTTGYLGQVTTIHKPSQTACYECTSQETSKVYPICTIRSTPSTPVHCIVWAKELYKLLFSGTTHNIEDSMLYETVTADPNNNNAEEEGEGGSIEPSTSTYMQAVLDFRQILQQRRDAGSDSVNGVMDSTVVTTNTFVELGTTLIQNLYVDEVQKQLNMDRYKTAQKKPIVLADSVVRAAAVTTAVGASVPGTTTTTITPPTAKATYKQTDVWSPEDCVIEFIACLHDAYINVDTVLSSFDKDDTLCMRFITASSNLRSIVFGISPIQSFYSAKGIAGNIIPAIATTNAIVAGLQILQCFQVLKAQLEHKKKQQQPTNDTVDAELTTLRDYCSYMNCIRNPTRNGLFLTAAELEGRNAKCFVCSKAILSLRINVSKWMLSDFISKLCKQEFGFEYPSITIESTGDCIWEEGEGADTEAFERNLIKLLPDLPCGGIVNGTIITIEDFTQDLTVGVAITHVDRWDGGDGDEEIPDDHKFIVVGGMKPQSTSTVAAATTAANHNDDDDDDDEIVEIVTQSNLKDDSTLDSKSGTKRMSDTDNGHTTKKLKTSTYSNNDCIEIDD